MSVLLETSVGDIVIDLFVKKTPKTCLNFLKLCKLKYYNDCLFHNIQKDFMIQTGDPTGTGKGGSSVFGLLDKKDPKSRFFEDEIRPTLKHKEPGMVAMANAGPGKNGSQFYITTREELTWLDETHTIFGQIAEGMEVVMKINEAFCDEDGRPFQNIRIRHTVVLEDPIDDPPGLERLIPERSPSPVFDKHETRLEDNEALDDGGKTKEQLDEELKAKNARAQATVLEIVGDIPDADVEPPKNILFVCRLNPITQDEDLEILFSRFGQIKSCEVIRDPLTNESLSYAFIEFAKQSNPKPNEPATDRQEEDCEEAYLKMNDVLIDDRRIHVDFSQSVAKMRHSLGGRAAAAQLMKLQGQHGGQRGRDGPERRGERRRSASPRHDSRQGERRDDRDRHRDRRDERRDDRRRDERRDRRDDRRDDDRRREERRRDERGDRREDRERRERERR